jgi:hypothetical protein
MKVLEEVLEEVLVDLMVDLLAISHPVPSSHHPE